MGIVGCGCCDVPNASNIVACSVSRTPSDATSFASGAGGAQRPEDRELDRDADDDHDHVREDDRERGGEREAELAGAERPEREAPSIAIAPAARLMKPEPRYVTPTAMAAIVAPVPRPRSRKRSVSFTSSGISADGAGQSARRLRWSDRYSSTDLLGRPDPAGRPRERELALVGERLEHVVADRRRVLVLAALELGGDPSASGPRNAFARAWTVFGVIPALLALTSLRKRTVVSICPKATMCHGSGAFFAPCSA